MRRKVEVLRFNETVINSLQLTACVKDSKPLLTKTPFRLPHTHTPLERDICLAEWIRTETGRRWTQFQKYSEPRLNFLAERSKYHGLTRNRVLFFFLGKWRSTSLRGRKELEEEKKKRKTENKRRKKYNQLDQVVSASAQYEKKLYLSFFFLYAQGLVPIS